MKAIRKIAAMTAAAMTVGALTAGWMSASTLGAETEAEKAGAFSAWTEGAASLDALTSFMEDITDENSENYIPVEDRIATFDFDGTLYGELAPNYFEYMMLYHRIMDDPSYTPGGGNRGQYREWHLL